jgi:ribonuclease T
MVAHNPMFDLGFINAMISRTGYKRSPFHPFSSFDTATVGGLVFGQTVLSRAVQAAGIEWNEANAHAAAYDAEKTADLFCSAVNRWKILSGM